ncbi:MAG: cation:proton antiporter [Pseudomonadota bacterium]|nr:cation:proton antiporter [Pseudomonadota bacterium]
MLAAAGYFRAPASLVLFGIGVLSAYLPGLPPVGVDPDLALTLFLPPLIYASTVRVSWRLLGFALVPGVLLGAASVLATAVAVALAAKLLLLPGLSWAGAILIGAVASIFDTQLFHEAKGRPRVPRAIADALKTRELVSRLIILATLALGIEMVNSGRLSGWSLVEHYLFDIGAGIGVGFVVGHGIVWARRCIDPAPVEIAVSIATPYIAAIAGEELGVSSVAAITTTALVVSAIRIDRETGATMSSAEARVSATSFWEEASLFVSSVLFFLAGRALPEAVGGLAAWPVWRLVAVAGALLAIVLAVQFAFSLPATMLKPIAGSLRAREGSRNLKLPAAGVMAWATTRSVIGLVIALAIPETFPDGRSFGERDLILILAAFLVMGSLLLQGSTLRWAVFRADLCEEGEEKREEEAARRAIEAVAGAGGGDNGEMHDAARRALIKLREEDRIGDEVLLRMLRETDLHARAAEEDVLPGAGPPNP